MPCGRSAVTSDARESRRTNSAPARTYSYPPRRMGRAVLAPEGTDLDHRERWTLSGRRFRQLAFVTAIGLCLLVVAGGIVRLTGSGLGCDDWPNCNDQSFVDVSDG